MNVRTTSTTSSASGSGRRSSGGLPSSSAEMLAMEHQSSNMISGPEDDDLSDKDEDSTGEDQQQQQQEDPLWVALDDLEGRVVEHINLFKVHSGHRSSAASSIYDELQSLLQPVLEIGAHMGPAVARQHYFPRTLEMATEEAYSRLISDLILPVLLESSQSDAIPAKRAVALQCFHILYQEYQKQGSYFQMGEEKRILRESELLRYWIKASEDCTVPGAFSSDEKDAAIASRAVLSASAVIRPSLRLVTNYISNANDAGALRIYIPLMRMINGVLRRLFSSSTHTTSFSNTSTHEDTVRSPCIKFLEVLVLCCTTREISPGQAPSRRTKKSNDFSLEDLPMGHPIITREALEEIGEYAYSTLRGLCTLSGQIQVDADLARELMAAQTQQDNNNVFGSSSGPSIPIIAILKPAALAFLEWESSQENNDGGIESTDNLELDFSLSQKSMALTINAISMLATNRPIFFRDSAMCLSQRVLKDRYDMFQSRASKITISSQFKASCLTLLRHSLSVTDGISYKLLHRALVHVNMKIQADKALAMAQQAAALKTAGRAARNRAAIFYEWDTSTTVTTTPTTGKRQRDDALAQMRAVKAARGLGQGIQLPTSMVDACELVLCNLQHLPSTRPAEPTKQKIKRKKPITLDYVVDAILTNGASLSTDESRWYDRDGAAAWDVKIIDTPKQKIEFTMDANTMKAAEKAFEDENYAKSKVYIEQCQMAAADAFSRIVQQSYKTRDVTVADFGNRVSARLAWTLKNVQPTNELKTAHNLVLDGLNTRLNKTKTKETSILDDSNSDKKKQKDWIQFSKDYSLVSSCLALPMATGAMNTSGGSVMGNLSNTSRNQTSSSSEGNNFESLAGTPSTLENRILNEAYLQKIGKFSSNNDLETFSSPDNRHYDNCMDVYLSSIVHACDRANDKPNDAERKKVATQMSSSLSQQLSVAPTLTSSALEIVSSMCDIDAITQKAAESARKATPNNLQVSAAAHAAKVAAEKRATSALLVLRDAAFQRSKLQVRRDAIDCAVGIAAGRLSASTSVEDKALKLVMNVLFPKATDLADSVIASATEELERSAFYAIENYKRIKKSNEGLPKNTVSEEEKIALERVRKPVVLYMALCVRRPEIIKTLLSISCRNRAEVLLKAVKNNMPKLAKATGTKYGPAKIANQVSELANNDSEVPLLLAFLDNLAPVSESSLPNQELIDVCHDIQQARLDKDGKKDARYIIPIVSGMKRIDLISKLPEFVAASDLVFKAALRRMSERLMRHSLMFREEPENSDISNNLHLNGMTLCEQVVYLHKMDFASAALPQKRYLDAIRLCLEDDEVFTDRVIMAALDHISGTFLAGKDGLPLAYMRTIILTCSKHESLHSWICHILLPRLVEGKVYTDRRQWEGWMRCAKMLENTGDAGVSSINAIQQLPEEQLQIYRSKYPKKN